MLVDRYYLYKADRYKINEIASLSIDLCDVEKISIERIVDENEILSLMLTSSEVERRYDHGDLSFVIRVDGRLAAILWACIGDCFVNGIGTMISCGYTGSYFYNVFVFPEFRRNKLLLKLMSQYAIYCNNEKITELYALVLVSNDKMNSFMDKYFIKERRISKINILSYKLGLDANLIESSNKLFLIRPNMDPAQYWI